MSPSTELLLTLLALTTPSGVDPWQTKLHGLAAPRLQALALRMELLDPRETRYVLARPEEFGDDLFTKFAKVSAALEKRLADWGEDDDEGDDEEEGSTKKGLPEKKRKKLLDPKTWERDGRLVEVATMLREALGDALFEDHNVFRDRVAAAL